MILDADAAVTLLVNVPCEYPSGVGGGTKPNLCKYCCWAEWGAIPSNSSGSKLKTAIVPSEDAA